MGGGEGIGENIVQVRFSTSGSSVWPPRWQPHGTEGISDRKRTQTSIDRIRKEGIEWMPSNVTRRYQGMQRIIENERRVWACIRFKISWKRRNS